MNKEKFALKTNQLWFNIKKHFTWKKISIAGLVIGAGLGVSLWHLANTPSRPITTDMTPWQKGVNQTLNEVGLWAEDKLDFKTYDWEDEGNLTVNNVNQQMVAENGKWKVFRDGAELYRVKKGKSEETKKQIFESQITDLNVTKDGIVFQNTSEEGRFITKVDFNGNDKKTLTNDFVLYVRVVDEWVYYSNENDNMNLYRVKIDGSKKEKVLNKPVFGTVVEGEDIYFTSGVFDSEKEGIYKTSLDGKEPEKMTDMKSWRFQVTDKWIYFINADSSQGKLYRIPKNGGEPELMVDDMVKSYFVENNKLYYSVFYDGKDIGFHVMDITNKTSKKVNDRIYYDLTLNGNQLYMMDFESHQSVRFDLLQGKVLGE